MRPIHSTQDLALYAESFVSFEIASAAHENDNCLLINGKKIARVSRKAYRYKEEEAYKFAILRKNLKFDYCYLNNSILKEINLTLSELSADEHELVEMALKDCPSKFAGGECFLEGCKLDMQPDTENVASDQTPIHLATKTSFFDKLDDNIMLFAVLVHSAHKILSWFQKKNKKEILQDKEAFNQELNEILMRLREIQKKLNKFSKKQEYAALQWACDGLSHYKKDLKQLPKKFARGLAPKKFAKIMGNVEYFLYEVKKEISPEKPKEKDIEISLPPQKPTWKSWLLRIW